jgi:ribosomal protein S18 acetylase RimI-like enzyme
VQIRRAVADDALAIATVHVRSWKQAFPRLIPQDYLDALSPDSRLGSWRETLAATAWPRTGTLVALGEGAPPAAAAAADRGIVGFVSISPSRDDDADPDIVGEIQTIYLDPTVWGTGAGDALMTSALDQLRAGGFSSVTLWTLGTNARARRFYERRGWRADGTSKPHDWGAFVVTDVRYMIDLT